MTEECFRISVDVCSLMEPPGTTNQQRSFGLPPCMWTSRLPVRMRAMARLNERFCSPAGFVRMGLPNSLLIAVTSKLNLVAHICRHRRFWWLSLFCIRLTNPNAVDRFAAHFCLCWIKLDFTAGPVVAIHSVSNSFHRLPIYFVQRKDLACLLEVQNDFFSQLVPGF